MHHIQGLFIMEEESKGRGVYTSIPISVGDVIEVSPVIIIPRSELPIIHKTVLHDYYFLWGHEHEMAAIALGYGSLYNHATFPNATFILDVDNKTIDIEAITEIQPGEEITINYFGESGSEGELWF